MIGLLAVALGLHSANNGTVGAITVSLERAFQIANTQIGLFTILSSTLTAVAASGWLHYRLPPNVNGR